MYEDCLLLISDDRDVSVGKDRYAGVWVGLVWIGSRTRNRKINNN